MKQDRLFNKNETVGNSRTTRPTFLKLGSHIPPWQQRDHIDSVVTGSTVKLTWVKCLKTVSDCLSNNFPKWMSYSYICATYFELTYPVLQTICDKETLGGLMFNKHFLFKIVSVIMH